MKTKRIKTISLKVDDAIFGETEEIVFHMRMPRNRYINDAIEYYNKVQKRRILESQLERESALVKNDSINVLKDFEKIDYAD